ncbi:BEM_collapsed_G0027490.mRNA.1.CDS.1 [Saccharomyces cerevisiae]|nr:hypothetical protein P283_I10206 [Saccharomyces cerevisiae P283]CAI7091615.1 BEM_collapsed_G0027490.mRNA.1.CDS.1 [Saccharomyces cerevisiae]
MNRFVIICLLFTYYVIWSLLPIFEIENSNPVVSLLFPISSNVAIFLPIFLLLIGFTLTGSVLGVLLIRSDKKKKFNLSLKRLESLLSSMRNPGFLITVSIQKSMEICLANSVKNLTISFGFA